MAATLRHVQTPQTSQTPQRDQRYCSQLPATYRLLDPRARVQEIAADLHALAAQYVGAGLWRQAERLRAISRRLEAVR